VPTADGNPATRDSAAVRDRLRAALDRAGVLDALDAALADAVAAAGGELSAEPVPAPPYLAVTSTGPVLRATLDAGRLVVRIEAFDVADGAVAWRDPSPADALSVEVAP